MSDIRKHSATSNIVRVLMKHSTTGVPLTGLTYSSAGLIIAVIADVEASGTAYAQASSNIEDITTLGTFAAPTASKCRFKEVDATNHQGLYEIQIADARFSVAKAKRLVVSWSGAKNLLAGSYEIVLDPNVDVNRVQGTVQTAGDVSAVLVELGATAAAKLAESTKTIILGTVDTGSFAATDTQFESDDVTEATASHYVGRTVLWLGGALIGQAAQITGYSKVGSNGHFTVIGATGSAMTEAPTHGDSFVII